MKFLQIENWLYTDELDGLLFFYQRCYEMLYNYVIDNYKAPILNTHFLADEFCVYNELVNQGIINSKYLDKILDEFKDSFCHDVVSKEMMGTAEIDYFMKNIGSCDRDEQSKRLSYYVDTFTMQYLIWTKKILSNSIKMPRNKKEIEALAKTLISELINSGYSAYYILLRLKNVFKDNSVTNMDSLQIFFNYFDFKRRKYVVYLAVSKDINIIRDLLEKKLDINFVDDGYFENLRHYNGKIIISVSGINALDDCEAVTNASDRLNLLVQFYEYILQKHEINMSKTAMIRDINENNRLGYISSNSEKFHVINKYTQYSAKQIARKTIDLLFSSRLSDVFDKFYKIINKHNNAAFGDNYEDGLLNLWQIVEMIIPISKEKENKSDLGTMNISRNRIDTIVEYMIPVFKKTYIKKMIYELLKYVKDWNIKIYSEIITKVDFVGTNEEKFAALVLLSEYETLRSYLYSQLEHFPIIKYRMFILNDTFHKICDVNRIINNHIKRVTWHIYRIYRIRNSIIHSGTSPEYIKSIGEHLHIYVDEFILEIFNTLSQKPYLSSLDAVLYDIKKTVEIYESVVVESDVITKDNLLSILNYEVVQQI